MEPITCGCDCHELDPGDTNVVKWQGKTWSPVCALRANIRLVGKLTHELDILREKVKTQTTADSNYQHILTGLQQLVCPSCFRKVGKRWVFYNGAVTCTDCAAD